MAVSALHRRHWQQRLESEAEAIAERRRWADLQARAAAGVLRAHWPQIRAVWLFGSVLEAGFGLTSDLDLCVEGLPSGALLEAMAVLDTSAFSAVPEQHRLPIDLVRLEALPLHWQERLRQRARLLT